MKLDCQVCISDEALATFWHFNLKCQKVVKAVNLDHHTGLCYRPLLYHEKRNKRISSPQKGTINHDQ